MRPPDAGREGRTLVTPSDVGGSKDEEVQYNATLYHSPGFRALMPTNVTKPGGPQLLNWLAPQTLPEALMGVVRVCRIGKLCTLIGKGAMKGGRKLFGRGKKADPLPTKPPTMGDGSPPIIAGGADTVEDEIAGKTGVVMGISVPDVEGRSVSYALGGYDFDETCMVAEDELESTGRIDRREDFFSGESIRVSDEGELLDD